MKNEVIKNNYVSFESFWKIVSSYEKILLDKINSKLDTIKKRWNWRHNKNCPKGGGRGNRTN